MKKSICIVDFDLSVYGGVEKVTVSLAAELAEYYEVYVVSLCMADSRPAFPLDERVHFSVLCGKPDRLRYLRKASKTLFNDFVREHNIRFVIFQGNYACYAAGTVLKDRNVRTVFFDHGALMNQWDRKDIRFIRWICSRKCSYVVTLTEQSRNDYIKKFRLRENRVRCIYNWIDDTVPASAAYDADSKRVISAGRFTYEKGFDHLIKIFAPAAERHPDWHLDIFGDGEEREKIEALIREYDAGDNIHLCGMVDDLDRRYGNYAMYVLPSYREGMPLVLLEAKHNRLPIVSFDIDTGPREIIEDGVNGCLIKPYDTEAMTEAMEKLMEDRDLRISMSEHAWDDMEKFSKDTITGQWVSLIEEK